jgi:hypothetical protein
MRRGMVAKVCTDTFPSLCCSLHCRAITEHRRQDVARLVQDSENDCRHGYVGRWVYKVRVLGPHHAREGWGEKQGPIFGTYTNKGAYSQICMVTIYLVGPTIDVEVVNTRAVELGPLMNHIQKI